MRVAVTGATGMIGRAVAAELARRGGELVALSRDADRARRVLGPGVEAVAWPDPAVAPPPAEALAGCDAVLNLMGEPLDQRWTAGVKRRIRESRVAATRNLVEALSAANPRPRVLVSQSGSGYYGARGAEPLDESASPGDDFLASVVVDWEREALRAEALGLRVAVARSGVVLAESGGALSRMLPFFKLGLGGPVAGGRQYLPWIHLDDEVAGLLLLLEHDSAGGPVNLTAPEPVTNAELSKALGRVLGRPAVLPVPALALRTLYGEMSMVVTTGARVVPRRLHELGYRWRRPELEPALREVTGRR